MMGTAEFHAERQTGLGGSDMGAILGLNQYRTPFQVWQEKTGRGEPFTGNLQTRFGTYAEQFVADEYCQQTGRRVQRFTAMLRHPEAPLIGHVDRLVIPDGAKIAAHRGEIRTDLGLEAKTAHALAASRGEDWGDAGTDQVPASYLTQCAVYMALTGCAHWDLAALFGNSDFRIYHLHRDQELEAMLVEEASRWWRDHVIADVPPDPQSEAEARQRWARHVDGKSAEADEELYQRICQLSDIKARIKALEADEQEIKDALIPALADLDTLTRNGRSILTYRANKDSQKVDWMALATRMLDDFTLPEDRQRILDDFTVTTPGARVLRLSKTLEA